MLKKSAGLYAITLAAMALVFSGCQKQDLGSPQVPASVNGDISTAKGIKKNFSSEVAAKWFDNELLLIKSTAGFTPPVASRALGYTGVALYESIVESMPEYASLKSKLGYTYTLPSYSPSVKVFWPAVANAALYEIEKSLFSKTSAANFSAMEKLYSDFHSQFATEVYKEDLDASEAYGKAVAKVIFNWSNTDGIQRSLINYTPDQYTPPTNEGAWVPTAPAFAQPLLPFWGDNRPFLAKNVDDACIPSPLTFAYSTAPTSAFYQMANEVYQTVTHLTPAQREIALYWNDGAGSITPPGHNINIVTQLIRSNNLTLEDAAIVYAKAGMTVADAFISCWKGKYRYSILRPITFIRQNIDNSWTSLIPTPPFPTYASGHATVSGATAALLTAIFGDKYTFTDHTNDGQFSPRQFSSFEAVADEAAMSRLYGGIHYRLDNEIGLQKGKMVGKNFADLKLKK